jgi:hypothetical protein
MGDGDGDGDDGGDWGPPSLLDDIAGADAADAAGGGGGGGGTDSAASALLRAQHQHQLQQGRRPQRPLAAVPAEIASLDAFLPLQPGTHLSSASASVRSFDYWSMLRSVGVSRRHLDAAVMETGVRRFAPLAVPSAASVVALERLRRLVAQAVALQVRVTTRASIVTAYKTGGSAAAVEAATAASAVPELWDSYLLAAGGVGVRATLVLNRARAGTPAAVAPYTATAHDASVAAAAVTSPSMGPAAVAALAAAAPGCCIGSSAAALAPEDDAGVSLFISICAPLRPAAANTTGRPAHSNLVVVLCPNGGAAVVAAQRALPAPSAAAAPATTAAAAPAATAVTGESATDAAVVADATAAGAVAPTHAAASGPASVPAAGGARRIGLLASLAAERCHPDHACADACLYVGPGAWATLKGAPLAHLLPTVAIGSPAATTLISAAATSAAAEQQQQQLESSDKDAEGSARVKRRRLASGTDSPTASVALGTPGAAVPTPVLAGAVLAYVPPNSRAHVQWLNLVLPAALLPQSRRQTSGGRSGAGAASGAPASSVTGATASAGPSAVGVAAAADKPPRPRGRPKGSGVKPKSVATTAAEHAEAALIARGAIAVLGYDAITSLPATLTVPGATTPGSVVVHPARAGVLAADAYLGSLASSAAVTALAARTALEPRALAALSPSQLQGLLMSAMAPAPPASAGPLAPAEAARLAAMEQPVTATDAASGSAYSLKVWQYGQYLGLTLAYCCATIAAAQVAAQAEAAAAAAAVATAGGAGEPAVAVAAAVAAANAQAYQLCIQHQSAQAQTLAQQQMQLMAQLDQAAAAAAAAMQ